MSNKYTAEEYSKCIELLRKGMSLEKVALKTGISRKAIRRNCLIQSTVEDGTATKAKIELQTESRLHGNNALKRARKEALTLGVEKASENIRERILVLVDLLFGTAEKALLKTGEIIALSGGEYDVDKDAIVAQLKYLQPIWTSALQAGQLLSGKPTAIQASIGKVQHDVTHRIEEYAAVYRELSGRGILCSTDEGDDSGESVG